MTTQQHFSDLLDHKEASLCEAVVENPPVLDPSTHKQSNAGTFHKIRKIIKKSSVSYFCDDCYTHYARLKWVQEDHPGFDVKNVTIIDTRRDN